jgi:hypothetical protein
LKEGILREKVQKKFAKMVEFQELFAEGKYAEAKKVLLELKDKIPEKQKVFYDRVVKELENKLAQKSKPPSPPPKQ